MSYALTPLMMALAETPTDAPLPPPPPLPVAGTAAPQPPVPTVSVAPVSAPTQLIGGNIPFLLGAVSNQPEFFGGLAINGGILVALGLGLTYDSSLPSNKTSFFTVLHAEYMLVNKSKYAFGPELALQLPFEPKAAATVTLAPGLAFWYAPFSAPVLIGAALDVNLVFTTSPSSNFAFDTVTPAVRIAYLF